MRRRPLRALALAAGCAIASVGVATATSHDHGQHGPATTVGDGAATTAFQAANDRMHAAMGEAFTGDPDVDFARSMIPHHQGAIDMARIVLEHGADPELRHLAEAIIAAQEAEIAFLRLWLERNGH